MDGIIAELTDLAEKVKKTRTILGVEGMAAKLQILEKEMQDPAFWNDREHATSVTKHAEELRVEISLWENLGREVDELLDLAREAEKENDHSLSEDLQKRVQELKEKFQQNEFVMLLSEKHDADNAILSIHAGTGGVDAQDWADVLLRMILRYCEKKGFRVHATNESRGQEAGLKSVTLHIEGRYAYGNLQSENGVHRLVRISPFDAEGMRHTSFALIEVLPELSDEDDIAIDEEDLRIDTFRSSGHGGQSVNTTDSAVRITHIPTGIVAGSQNERSQHQNKAFAMKMLKSKLQKLQEEEREEVKAQLRGEYNEAVWGNQIRSYVLHPYKLVKDHRTDFETTNPDAVLNGDLQDFIEAYLKWKKSENSKSQ